MQRDWSSVVLCSNTDLDLRRDSAVTTQQDKFIVKQQQWTSVVLSSDNALGLRSRTSQQIIDELYASITVIGNSQCPAHPQLPICRCPAAPAAFTPLEIQQCKTDYFVNIWENILLSAKDHAFNYDGSQASHQAFVAAEGVTPKRFARAFLRDGILRQLFAPSGRLQATVQSMLDFWIARVTDWREKYGNVTTAWEHWDKELDQTTGSRKGHALEHLCFLEFQQKHIIAGSTVPTADFECGPPGHHTTITLMPVMCEVAASNENAKVSALQIRIASIKECHPNCPVSQHAVKEGMPYFTQEIAKRFFGMYGAQKVLVPDVFRAVNACNDIGQERDENRVIAEEMLRQASRR